MDVKSKLEFYKVNDFCRISDDLSAYKYKAVKTSGHATIDQI